MLDFGCGVRNVDVNIRVLRYCGGAVCLCQRKLLGNIMWGTVDSMDWMEVWRKGRRRKSEIAPSFLRRRLCHLI